MSETMLDTIHIISLEGKYLSEYDFNSVIEEVEELIQQDVNNFVINLDQLSFMNSSGLGALMKILTKARTSGGEAVLAGGNEQMAKLLLMTKLNQVFKVFESNDAAKTFLTNNSNKE